MRIIESARKHGITELDMLHVCYGKPKVLPLPDGFTMLIGRDRKHIPLEVGVLRFGKHDPVIIHAMECRRKYRRLL